MANKAKLNIPSSAHMIGIGGIGMSGLAQMLKWQGCEVSGSDREIDKPYNSGIFDSLTRQGIKLFPQNGSYIRDFTPDVLVFSSAIENDNPDFKAAPDLPKFHRAETLATAIKFAKDKTSIAVTGSSGKTTVTAWLAETLYHMGLDPLMLAGGLANRFMSKKSAGNFRPGNGKFIVYEADESDKSLLSFEPDYAVILNIGTDHYPHAELLDVFRDFLSRVKKGAVLEENVYRELKPENLKHLDITLITEHPFHYELPAVNKKWGLSNYKAGVKPAASIIEEESEETFDFRLPLPGHHSAMNALAVFSTLDILGLKEKTALRHISRFKGVWRRFDYAGRNHAGADIYDDYAHNVEKIISCIKTAKEVAKGKIVAIFQPHGFKPLGFMRGKLFEELEKNLSENDIFILLPVYYAGGTSSFQPEAEEVVQEYRRNGKKQYLYFSNRSSVESYLQQAKAGDVIVIMGARDNSLSAWAKSLAKNKKCLIL